FRRERGGDGQTAADAAGATLEDPHFEAGHAMDLRHADIIVWRAPLVCRLRAGASARWVDGADIHRLPGDTRRVLVRCRAPAFALEGRTDRRRPGMVRPPVRRLDLADA